MSQGNERFIQEVKANFSQESTDEEAVAFLKSCPLFDGQAVPDLLKGYLFVRLLGKNPYDSLISVMDCIYKAIEETGGYKW